jgi:uncharacterized protein (DUF1800 family)
VLPTTSSFERTALNRVSFGATSDGVQAVQASGWRAWVEQQLGVTGDDPALAQHLKSQTMPIKYPAASADSGGTWTAVDEVRPLNYLNADVSTLWKIGRERGKTIAPAEEARALEEVIAATWIRNAHASGQLREFMTDFWHNHFNIGKDQNHLATVTLPVYDRAAIRPYVFGNFRQMLEANATSTSMQAYLDNWLSDASHPNENYAREIAELQTLGGGAYLGIVAPGSSVPVGADGVALGFTDADVTQNSLALSGWTLANGQRESKDQKLPVTGAFVYNPAQHNTHAGKFMNVDLSGLTADMAQGRKVMDILANHSATANFVVGKLARRMFGDSPPLAVVTRGVNAWNANKSAPDQIARVLEAMLLDGPEVGAFAAAKVRRPYERLIAMFRTTGMVVNASASMSRVLDVVKDGLFAWTAPNGRPDADSYWSSTGAQMTAWNLALSMPANPAITTSLTDQTPTAALSSATLLVEYWVGRMIGYETPAMSALAADQTGPQGTITAAQGNNRQRIETALRRLVALITTTRDFVYR